MRRSLLGVFLMILGSSAAWPGDPANSLPVASPVSSPSCAATVEGDRNQAASRPFVKVLNFHVPGPPVVPAPYSEGAMLLCRDRQLLRIGISGIAPDAALVPHFAQVDSGQVTPAAWRELTESAGAARIGFVRSCRPEVFAGAVRAEITWFGRGTRSNTFVLNSFDFSLPACSSAVEDFYRRLQQPAVEPDFKTILIPTSTPPIDDFR